LRRFSKNGEIDLQGWSKLASEQGLAFSDLPSQLSRKLLSLDIPTFSSMYGPSEMYSIFGGISDADWQVINAGGTIRVSTQEARDGMWRLLSKGIVKVGPKTKRSPLFDYPTEVFPNGLPAAAEILISSEPELTLRVPKEQRTGASEASVQDQVARAYNAYRYVVQHVRQPGAQSSVQPNKLLDGVLPPLKPGIRNVYNVHFIFSPGLTCSLNFKGTSRIVGPASSFSALPEAYQVAALKEWSRLALLQEAQ
jgi:hypothetical protein